MKLGSRICFILLNFFFVLEVESDNAYYTIQSSKHDGLINSLYKSHSKWINSRDFGLSYPFGHNTKFSYIEQIYLKRYTTGTSKKELSMKENISRALRDAEFRVDLEKRYPSDRLALKVSVYKDATFETIKALHFINQSKLNYLIGSLDEMLKSSTDEEEILTVEYLTSVFEEIPKTPEKSNEIEKYLSNPEEFRNFIILIINLLKTFRNQQITLSQVFLITNKYEIERIYEIYKWTKVLDIAIIKACILNDDIIEGSLEIYKSFEIKRLTNCLNIELDQSYNPLNDEQAKRYLTPKCAEELIRARSQGQLSKYIVKRILRTHGVFRRRNFYSH